jgi:hypothetical protein
MTCFLPLIFLCIFSVKFNFWYFFYHDDDDDDDDKKKLGLSGGLIMPD